MSVPPQQQSVGPQLGYDFLKTAVSDAQSTARTNARRTGGLLLLQGLLFIGTLTVTSRLGSVFTGASFGLRLSLAIVLGAALILFALSMWALLTAALPYTPPPELTERMRHKSSLRDLFAPDLAALAEGRPGSDELSTYLLSLRLCDPDALEAELAYELLRTQHVRARDSRWTRLGARLLVMQLLAVLAALALIGVAGLQR